MSADPTHTTKRLLFLKALAESDEPGMFLDKLLLGRARQAARKHKDRRLEAAADFLEEDLARRKHLDCHKLYQSHPAIFPFVLFVCFLTGLGSNYLGPSTRVNLLLNPLVILFVWNLAIYLMLLLPKRFGSSNIIGELVASISKRLVGRIPSGPWDSDEKGRDILLKARLAFHRFWLREAGDFVRYGVMSKVHLCAAVLVMGVVGGLYLRGLVQAYEFVWSSTFIKDQATLESVLEVFYSPVLFLGGIFFENGLPPIEPEQGALWIHLLAMTAVIYIILPRGILAFTAWRKAAGLKLQPDLNTPFFLELLKDDERRPVHLFLYSYAPEDTVLDRLKNTCRDLWGSGLEFRNPTFIDWGLTEMSHADWMPNGLWLLCFSGVQTPEEDVHGHFTSHLLEQARLGNCSVLIIVDNSKVAADKMSHRQLAWEQVLGSEQPFAWLDTANSTTWKEDLSRAHWRPET